MLNHNIKFSGDKIKSHKRLTYDILDGMVDWVRVIDKNGIVIYANKPMEEGVGKSIVGSKCYTALGKCCACRRCITQTTIATGVSTEKEEVVGDRIFAVKSSPVKDVDGNIYASVEVFRDVTRERKLEAEILRKNEKMSKDLCFARTLQNKILPRKGIYGNIKIDYMYHPSEMLSGDMFDVFKIDEEHIGIYISDVVGHGVTASMMTMFIRQTVRAIKSDVLSPSEVLKELHKRFLDLNLEDDKYFTIFYGVINMKNKIFRYSNGGHNSIPILHGKNDIALLEAKGYPICYLFDDISYDEKEIVLNTGDKLLFYTDGIIETKNQTGELFGLERLTDIVKNSSDSLISAIEGSINHFKSSDQEDDFAILTMEVLE